MKWNEDYFNQIKQECIQDCGSHSLEEIAKGMFKKSEIVDLFLNLEETDEAYSVIIDVMQEYILKKGKTRIYIPGCGGGGLTRRILKKFPEVSILQVDNSKEMIEANKQISSFSNKTNFVVANILEYFPKTNSIDIIVAYGIMRYISSSVRDKLVSSWSNCLAEDGIIIIGEGVAKDIVTKINPQGYSSEKNIERNANLFRVTLFYLLFRRYEADNVFKTEILKAASKEKLNYTQKLKNIAGFTSNKVYVKLLTK